MNDTRIALRRTVAVIETVEAATEDANKKFKLLTLASPFAAALVPLLEDKIGDEEITDSMKYLSVAQASFMALSSIDPWLAHEFNELRQLLDTFVDVVLVGKNVEVAGAKLTREAKRVAEVIAAGA